MSLLSQRGRKLLKETPPLVKAHIECALNPFDAKLSPDGFINFGTAENKVLENKMLARMNESHAFKVSDLHYNSQEGSLEFRQALQRHLAPVLGVDLEAKNLAVASGASAILEMLSMCLLNSGDKIFIPGPFYAGFLHDFEVRFEGVVVTAEVITANGIDFHRLESELRRTQAKVLMLNNPHNPTGYVFSEQDIKHIGAVCRELGLQIIADEIYAQSVYQPNVKFVSALKVLKGSEVPVHWVYGMAKDFGLSGLKVGVFTSTSEEVIQAMQAQCYFHTVSGTVQRNLIHVLSDNQVMTSLMAENRDLLLDRYKKVEQFCARLGVKMYPGAGGIFCYIDLSPFMGELNQETEFTFFRKLFESTKVNISPSQFFRAENFGRFRLCFAQELDTLRVGLRRLEDFLKMKN
jgi:aspartate/methionine/tyrosine aminotransferase